MLLGGLISYSFSAFSQDQTRPLEDGESPFKEDRSTDELLEDEYEREDFDVIEFPQRDGSRLHINGLRIGRIYYTETIDGYTIVLNDDGLYEYAELTNEGDLEPSGVRANDPEQRADEEQRFLRNHDKHIRYEPPKLDELNDKSIYEFHEREN